MTNQSSNGPRTLAETRNESALRLGARKFMTQTNVTAPAKSAPSPVAMKEIPQGSEVKNVKMSECWVDWSRNPRDGGKRPREANKLAFESLRNDIRAQGCLEPPIAHEEAPPAKMKAHQWGDPATAKYRIVGGYRRFDSLIDLFEASKGEMFATTGLSLRSKGAIVSSEEVKDEKTGVVSTIHTARLVSDKLREMLAAIGENEQRLGLSVWDRIEVCKALDNEAMAPKEISGFLTESGTGISIDEKRVNTYLRMKTFPAGVYEQLRAAQGTGYNVAKFFLANAKEFYAAGYESKRGPKAAAAPVQWDEKKMRKHIEKEMGKFNAETGERIEAPKKTKKKAAKYIVAADVMLGRLKKIDAAGGSGPFLASCLSWMLGKTDDETLREATSGEDQDMFEAFTGLPFEPDAEEEAAE